MASFTNKDYYRILGVEETASTEEIRHAFQKKARVLHPDVNKETGAEEQFKEVSEAYAVLSDPKKRQQYDLMRTGRAPSPFGGASGAPTGAPGAGFGFGGFSSPFGVAGRQPAYKPTPGQNVRVELNLSKEEAKQGCKKGLSYDKYVKCEVCDGSGSKYNEQPAVCSMCGGTGHLEIDLAQLMGLGLGVMQMPCPQCEGSGRVVQDPCECCGGTGRHMGAAETIVEVPPKTHDHSSIYKDGLGNAGTNGSQPGDLEIDINIPHERLSHESAQGFKVMGFCLPFLLFCLTFSQVIAVLVAVLVGVCIGAALVIKAGVLKRSGEWWLNGAKALLSGAINGVFIAFLLMMLISCSEQSMMNLYAPTHP